MSSRWGLRQTAPMFYDLALGTYDVDRPPGPSPVRRSYLLCSNPRSGSTLLSEALHGLGMVGTPIEYFDGDDTMLACTQRWGCENVRCYVQCLHRHRTTPEGILGAKLHWYQLQEMTFALYSQRLPGVHGRQRWALAEVFPECSHVFCIREDKDRQAVSWAIARATGHWADLGIKGPAPPVAYDFDAIHACRIEIDAAETGWRELFEVEGICPLTVTYEELAADYRETVAAVARHVGADLQAGDIPAPRLRKQSNEHSRWLLEQYLQERESRFG